MVLEWVMLRLLRFDRAIFGRVSRGWGDLRTLPANAESVCPAPGQPRSLKATTSARLTHSLQERTDSP